MTEIKYLIITNNVKNKERMLVGLEIARQAALTVDAKFVYEFKDTSRVFNSINFENQTVGKGACVDPNEILQEVNGNYKIACLIFDADKVIGPRPTNPVQHPILKNGCNVIQIPEFWYGEFPSVLADYFMHETDHSGYFFKGDVANDKTHFMHSYPEWTNKQAMEYYLFLLKQLLPYLGTTKPDTPPVPTFTVLKLWSRGPMVRELQGDLNLIINAILDTDGVYGTKTRNAVVRFQQLYGLQPDGIAGPLTLNKIIEIKKKVNDQPPANKVDIWCEAIKAFEGWKPGSVSYRNNNPGNIKYVGQKTAIGQDSRGFCVFPDYTTGYLELRNMLLRIATRKTNYYDPDMSILQWANVYAPSSDGNYPFNYASYVASRYGVGVDTPIKNLI